MSQDHVRWSGPPRPHAQGTRERISEIPGHYAEIFHQRLRTRVSHIHLHALSSNKRFPASRLFSSTASPRQTRPTAVRQPPVTAASLRIVRLQQCVLDLLSCWPATCAWTAPLRGAELRHEPRVLDLRPFHVRPAPLTVHPHNAARRPAAPSHPSVRRLWRRRRASVTCHPIRIPHASPIMSPDHERITISRAVSVSSSRRRAKGV